MRKTLYISSVVALVILAVTSLICGMWLMLDPTGESFGFDTGLLSRTPFEDYFVPGFLLFSGNGLLAVLTLTLVVIKSKFRSTMLILQGLILIIWLSTQVFFGIFEPILHLSYYFLGVLLVIYGLLYRKTTNKHHES